MSIIYFYLMALRSLRKGCFFHRWGPWGPVRNRYKFTDRGKGIIGSDGKYHGRLCERCLKIQDRRVSP